MDDPSLGSPVAVAVERDLEIEIVSVVD